MQPKLQKYLPQRLLSRFVGALANSKTPCIKNNLIKNFIKTYPVNMQEAELEDPYAYKTFNNFFTRTLKTGLRSIASGHNAIASPVDGTIYQLGKINEHKLIHAKGHDFTIADLLGPKINHSLFKHGVHINIYLSPLDYHRVHMPLTGTLTQMNYIPGKLFSVNNITASHIPNLFAKNERVVSLFQTDLGPMAIILVGAMIVGSIETSWAGTLNPTHGKKPTSLVYPTNAENSINLTKGQELGLFKMDSTVIVLLANEKTQWLESLSTQSKVLMGQQIGIASN